MANYGPLVDKSRHQLLIDILAFHNFLVYQANYSVAHDKETLKFALEVFDNWVMGLKNPGPAIINQKDWFKPVNA